MRDFVISDFHFAKILEIGFQKAGLASTLIVRSPASFFEFALSDSFFALPSPFQAIHSQFCRPPAIIQFETKFACVQL